MYGCYDPCGFGAPVAAAPVAAPAYGAGRGFALIVVLFILLIIIGAAYVRPVAAAPVAPPPC